MKILIPQSLFSAIFAMTFSDYEKRNVSVQPSSVIPQILERDEETIGLIPSCDLYKHKNLYVSQKIGLSFDGLLSNSYLYFLPGEQSFENLFLRGDVSTNEIILTKILFSERFSQDVQINLDTDIADFESRNYLIVGNENLQYKPMERGISFADQIASLIDFPYVNFVLASKNKELIEEFVEGKNELDNLIEDNIESYLSKMELDPELYDGIVAELNSVYFEITHNEIEALRELLKLPFYKGIFKDIIEIKLV